MPYVRESHRSRISAMWLTILVVIATAALAGGWAARALLAPAPDVLQPAGYVLVAAQRGTVEHTMRLNTSARWLPESTVAGRAAGIVTEVRLSPGQTVTAGEVVMTVDLRPVVVAEGEVPAFRDLAVGATGADVSQVQRLLAERGYWSAPVDGRFGESMHWAVRAWQQDLGVTQDGLVRAADVVFVPGLPARLAPTESMRVGAVLAGGEPVVQVLPVHPSFTIALPDGQAQSVTPGMAVEIDSGGDEPWLAEIVEVRRSAEQGTMALLAGVDGDSICGNECELIPIHEETLLSTSIKVVPRVEGVSVPAAAVVTTAAGRTVVVLDDGSLRPVKVVASGSGVAIVAGLEVGDLVRTPGAVTDESGGRVR